MGSSSEVIVMLTFEAASRSIASLGSLCYEPIRFAFFCLPSTYSTISYMVIRGSAGPTFFYTVGGFHVLLGFSPPFLHYLPKPHFSNVGPH